MRIFLALFFFTAYSAFAADRPNIVIFLVDDMGLMDTTVPFLVDEAGNPQKQDLNSYYRTPSMERLAAQGTRFSQFYAQSVCSPTRISILTGQNAARHHCTQFIAPAGNNRGTYGPEGWRWIGLKEGELTLPHLFSEAGYTSIHVGKAHYGPVDSFASEPLNLGFDVNVAGHAWGAPGSYFGESNYGAPKSPKAVPGLEKYHGTETFLSEALTIEAKAELDKVISADKPFFLYFGHYAVHSPFHSDPRFAGHYESSDKPKNAKAYATLIEGMDKSLGDLMDHLEAKGIAEETLIFFVGDNGSDAPLGPTHDVASSAPLRGKKGTHYEGGMRVPFIAAWAKPNAENPIQKAFEIPQGEIQTKQIGVVHELFTTSLDAAGIDIPAGYVTDGGSLRKLLVEGSDDSRQEEFLMHFPHSHRSSYFTSFRSGDWKLVYHYPVPRKKNKKSNTGPFPRYELFHLSEDPTEATNLAESHPDDLKRMVKAMAGALEAQGALYAIDEEGKQLKPE